ncbi:unnamed protein product [Ceutorhynchus assimilis]|uniref:DNA primase large subunit n=1 Tax=Ceutorhynchus assimilis TaxID=467358 RepID=A0A9N9QIZ4_9CUCU|nr:unnamed protein product [Ceutorhynchus assimilis]
MDTNARRRRVHTTVEDTEATLYNHDLSLYPKFPCSEIPLSEFEELAIDRVQLFRIIEQASLKGHKYFSDEWKKCIKDDMMKNNLKKFVRLLSGFNGQTELDIQARRADHISHFILRIAYCRSEELRKWFLARELEWFKIKFVSNSTPSILKFLQLNELNYQTISNEEKEDLKESLIVCTPGMNDVQVMMSEFYKVPFLDVWTLVQKRRVFLKEGYAYIPINDLVVSIQSTFRTTLSSKLVLMNRNLPNLDDERLSNLLCNLHQAYTGNEYTVSNDKDAINPADIDEYSKKHYPLCMRNLHETLRANHHLKHYGRLIYGLFLKAIGLKYEQFIEFWRSEFTKTMDTDAFNKNHLYNFNHQFGKVGKRVNYSPYSCMKIIMSNVGAGDAHCCPFRHFDVGRLRAKISECGAPSEGVSEIMQLVNNGHYQIACTKYFQYTHPQPSSNTINHPNQYFEESMNLVKDKTEKIVS